MARSHSFNSIHSIQTQSSAGSPPTNSPISKQEISDRQFGAKSGFIDQAPNKIKKEGGGRGNWGRDDDYTHQIPPYLRRRSSSNVQRPELQDEFRTKFEEVEDIPDVPEEM
ncbi:hypothetical protein YB2330_000904 [Saitoella coloradoensis]